jgi:hypothetical protein
MKEKNMRTLNWLLSGAVVLLSLAHIVLWADRNSYQIASSDSQSLGATTEEDRCIEIPFNEPSQISEVALASIVNIDSDDSQEQESLNQVMPPQIPVKIAIALKAMQGIEKAKDIGSLSVYAEELMQKLDTDNDSILSLAEASGMRPILFVNNVFDYTLDNLDEDTSEAVGSAQNFSDVYLSATEVENALLILFDNADRDHNGLLEGEELKMFKRSIFPKEMDLLYFYEKIK